MTLPSHYDRHSLAEALRSIGLAEGDTVFTHVGMGMLGLPAGEPTEANAFATILGAFQDVLGPTGTLLVPTYSYSFCGGRDFDPQATPSAVGPFSERFRQVPGVVRSLDPIFSVAGLGPAAEALFRDLPHDCFGPDCLYDRLRRQGALICNIGVGFRYATFIHHVEQMAGVPYRYRKQFAGTMAVAGQRWQEIWTYYVRVLDGCSWADLSRLEAKARAAGACRATVVGRGEVVAIACDDLFELAMAEVRQDRWYLATGPSQDPVAADARRVPPIPVTVAWPAEPSLPAPITALYPIPRDPVSDGAHAAMQALAGHDDLTLETFATGEPAGDRYVPEKWTCRTAELRSPTGDLLIDGRLQPWRLGRYSTAQERSLTLAELQPFLLQATGDLPLINLAGKRTWGFTMRTDEAAALPDGDYEVTIEAATSFGTMPIATAELPGRSERTLVLAARLGPTGAANEGLSGLAVAMAVWRELGRRDRACRFRLVIVPDTIGWAAYWQRHADDRGGIAGGLILDQLGLNGDLTLSLPLGLPAAMRKACDAVDTGMPSVNGVSRTPWDEVRPYGPALPVLLRHSAGAPQAATEPVATLPEQIQLPALQEAVATALQLLERMAESG